MKKCISYWDGVQAVAWFMLIKLASFFKVSFIVGSQFAHFSAVSIGVPVVGLISGISGCGFLFILKMILGFMYNPTGVLHLLAFCVPGFCASLYLASSHSGIRLVLPIACMILFLVHPVGFSSFAYALYWLIPIILYFIRKKSLFLHALGSTFIAHAVGSVIWLYTMPTSPVLWLSLTPIVIIERLFFASGITMFYFVFCNLKNRLRTSKFLNKRGAIPRFIHSFY